jgi:hypothetical protein
MNVNLISFVRDSHHKATLGSRCTATCVTRPRSAVEEFSDRNVERDSDHMQPAGADPVLAILIFLNLLECHSNRFAELFLAYLAALAQKAMAWKSGSRG